MDFIQGAVVNGVLSSQALNQLRALNDPALWSLCGIRQTVICLAESFGFLGSPGGGMCVLPHLSVIATVVVMAIPIIGFA